MINVDLSNVNAAVDGERRGLAAGGYVCGITRVENVAASQYLKIEFDIAEGENKNYYRELQKNYGFWGGSFVRSYKEKALPFFKGFITCVEKSNNGYRWNYDENGLCRKLVGLVLGEEEYWSEMHGEVRTRLTVSAVRSIDDIRQGNFTVPEIKRLAGTPAAGAAQGMSFQSAPLVNDEDDLPF